MRYIDWLGKLEDVVDETTYTTGYLATRVSPLLGPLVSGLSILFAFYDGGGALLSVRGVGGAYWVAGFVGLFVAFNLEGLTITHMVIGDRIRSAVKRNETLSEILSEEKATSNKTSLLWFTLVTILMIETLPAGVAWWYGLTSAEVAIFRMGLIVFPWLSRNAASAYSLLRVLDEVDSTERDFRVAKKKQRLQAILQERELWAKFERDQRLEDEKLGAKVLRVSSKTVPNKVSNTVSENNPPEENTENNAKETIEKMIVRFYKNNEGAKLDDVAAKLGSTKGTISKKITELVDKGVLQARKEGKRRIVSVNGHHEEFLNDN